jgi:hypothetical protein
LGKQKLESQTMGKFNFCNDEKKVMFLSICLT